MTSTSFIFARRGRLKYPRNLHDHGTFLIDHECMDEDVDWEYVKVTDITSYENLKYLIMKQCQTPENYPDIKNVSNGMPLYYPSPHFDKPIYIGYTSVFFDKEDCHLQNESDSYYMNINEKKVVDVRQVLDYIINFQTVDGECVCKTHPQVKKENILAALNDMGIFPTGNWDVDPTYVMRAWVYHDIVRKWNRNPHLHKIESYN